MNFHSRNSIVRSLKLALVPVVVCIFWISSPVIAEFSNIIIYSACNVSKYPNGSEYETNVNAILKSMADKATSTGFSSGSYGQSPNQVFGRLQCRADLSPGDCKICSTKATKSIGEECPNAVGARIQLEYCFLRYENYTFLSKLDASFWYGLVNVKNNTDPDFNRGVRTLMLNLSTEAPVTPKLAAESTLNSSSLTIYGLEMCWRDMSSQDCATCLSKGLVKMYGCCAQRTGVQIFMGSCTIRYEIYPFTMKS